MVLIFINTFYDIYLNTIELVADAWLWDTLYPGHLDGKIKMNDHIETITNILRAQINIWEIAIED